MNKQMNMPKMNKIMAEFVRENEKADMTQVGTVVIVIVIVVVVIVVLILLIIIIISNQCYMLYNHIYIYNIYYLCTHA